MGVNGAHHSWVIILGSMIGTVGVEPATPSLQWATPQTTGSSATVGAVRGVSTAISTSRKELIFVESNLMGRLPALVAAMIRRARALQTQSATRSMQHS